MSANISFVTMLVTNERLIDVFSTYVWVRPMKNKAVHSLLEAFDSVLSEGRKPEKLRTDKGTELLNESF